MKKLILFFVLFAFVGISMNGQEQLAMVVRPNTPSHINNENIKMLENDSKITKDLYIQILKETNNATITYGGYISNNKMYNMICISSKSKTMLLRSYTMNKKFIHEVPLSKKEYKELQRLKKNK
jgi:hypothetical protein